jgi:hypothetical protein
VKAVDAVQCAAAALQAGDIEMAVELLQRLLDGPLKR